MVERRSRRNSRLCRVTAAQYVACMSTEERIRTALDECVGTGDAGQEQLGPVVVEHGRRQNLSEKCRIHYDLLFVATARELVRVNLTEHNRRGISATGH
jgi:hypothetical protein